MLTLYHLAVTNGNYLNHLMRRSVNTPGFDTLQSILRCGGGHCKLNVSTFVNIHMMLSYQWNSFEEWLAEKKEAISNCVLHYATSLRGMTQYWFKQRSRLIAMVDTLGLPTVFFTHSAADLQWPELARLICPDDQDSSFARNKAVQENPAIADWFFYHHIVNFIDAFYTAVLGATDCWFRFEWQHRGRPHLMFTALPGYQMHQM